MMAVNTKHDRNTELISDYLDGMRPADLARKYKITAPNVDHLLRKWGGKGIVVMMGVKVHNHLEEFTPHHQHVSVPFEYFAFFRHIVRERWVWENLSFRKVCHEQGLRPTTMSGRPCVVKPWN
jgi:hypothetical protein